MRKVELNLKENYQYKIIKRLVETNGSKKHAAIKLNCTVRHINRLIKKYKVGGKGAFMHGNKHKEPTIKFSNEDRTHILDIYCLELYDANLLYLSAE